MKISNRVFLSIALLLSTITIAAQTDANVFGHVLDAKSGEHIPFATVQLTGSTIGTTTDESGHYFLSNLPVGRQTLSFSYVGFETLNIEVEIVSGKTLEVNAELQEQTVELGSVEVTSVRYVSKDKSQPSIVTVLAPELFEVTSAATMAEVLNYSPGLRVEQTCANCGMMELRINGMGGNYSQLLMDTRPVFSSLAMVYGLEQIPAGMVDHVNVIRGGGSALYSSSSIAGVVDIITKEPTRNSVSLSNTSSMLRHHAYDINTALNASLISDNRKAGVFLFAVQRNRRQYDHDGDGFSDLPKLSSTTAGMRSFFKVTNYSKLTAEYHHVTDFRRGGDRFDQEPHEALVAEQLRHNIDAASLTYDYYSADGRHYVKAFSSLQNVARESYFGTYQDKNGYGRTNDLITVSGLQYRFSYLTAGMPTDLTIGAEYSYNNLHDRILGYNRDNRQQVHIGTILAQNEWKNDVWGANVGFRLEHNSMLKSPIFVPRVSVRYTPLSGVVLRAAYSAGYRAPQTYDEDLHVEAVGGVVSLISLDPNLRPETSHGGSVSIDYYGRWGEWDLNLSAEGFSNYLKDVFYLREDGHNAYGNLMLTRTNAAGALVAGLNLEGRVSYRDIFSWQIGYTFQKSQYMEAVAWSDNPDVVPEKRMLRTPDNHAYSILTVQPVHDFKISLNLKATGSMLVPHFAGYIAADRQEQTKPFWDLGAKLSYDIHLYRRYCLEVNCGVKNVLNQYQTDLDQGADRDSGYIYGPSLPRTWFIGFNLKI